MIQYYSIHSIVDTIGSISKHCHGHRHGGTTNRLNSLEIDRIFRRYLSVDSNVPSMNGLKVSSEFTAQDVYLEESSIPHRIIVINCNYLTLFCIFYFGK